MEYNIGFSTDTDPAKFRSKAIYIIGQGGRNQIKPVNLRLCGKNLPWVERADHLGDQPVQICVGRFPNF